MRKDDLIDAILGASGGEPTSAGARSRPSDRGRSRRRRPTDASRATSEERRRAVGGHVRGDVRATRRRSLRTRPPSEPPGEEEPEVVEDEISDEEIATGVLDVLANGSGFVRVDPFGQSRDDVYVSPAQIRRCELRAGDEVSGPVRPPRRNERHPSLVRVETVNGAPPSRPRSGRGSATSRPSSPPRSLTAPKALEGRAVRHGLARGDRRAARRGRHGAAARARDTSWPATSELGVAGRARGRRPEEVTEWRRDDGADGRRRRLRPLARRAGAGGRAGRRAREAARRARRPRRSC